MSNQSYLKQIEAIKAREGRSPRGKPIKKYRHTIFGKSFNEGLAWWAEAKSITDPVPINAAILYNRLYKGSKWALSDALGAYKGESIADYRWRVYGEQEAALELDIKTSVINTWLSSARAC